MTDIENNIILLNRELPSSVRLVAVSKTKPVPDIMEAYNTGQRIFGENRVQELLAKKDLLPPDIEWHLIGHLQRNKVKYIVPFVAMIHSADSFRLIKVIDQEGSKVNRIIPCLIQFHIADEETKFGFSLDEALSMLSSEEFRKIRFVSICGVMGMATFTSDRKQISKEFIKLKGYFDILRDNYFSGNELFKEISMGMSDDFKIAIEEGSTMVRIGSIIFGERN